MSFAYKKINPSDIKSVPYIANKQYEFTSESYSDNNIQTYVGEYIPITTENPFDPVNDNLTTDGNYRRLLFESIRHLFYENYITASSLDQIPVSNDLLYATNINYFWHTSSYINYEQNTMASGSYPNFKNFPYFTALQFNYDDPTGSYYGGNAVYFQDNAARVRIVSIPKDKYGEGIKPHSFILSGSSFYIADDGQGNLFDYEAFRAEYFSAQYSDPISKYAGLSVNEQVPNVGNIFYGHGIAVITNQDYICFIEGNPVAKNDYYDFNNVQEEKTLLILSNDFDDCLSIDTSSVNTLDYPGYTFPDFTISGSGDIVITPNQTSVTPGEYRLQYSYENNLGLVSNTGSIFLNINTNPLEFTVNSITQACYLNPDNISASVTFSIDKGAPPYSWSIDNSTYIPIEDLFQPTITASILPTRSQIIYVKDHEGSISTASINTGFNQISCSVWEDDVSFCGTINGAILVSASNGYLGDTSSLSASLSTSFDNAIGLPGTFPSLSVGLYDVIIKDANNCTSISQMEVTKTQPVTVSYLIDYIDCFGSSTGEIYWNRADMDTEETGSDEGGTEIDYLDGGKEPLEWEWEGPNGFVTTSQELFNVPSGSYILNITDDDGCIYGFNYEITTSAKITFTTNVTYSNEEFPILLINDLTGGIPPYNITASSPLSEYLFTASVTNSYEFNLDGEGLNSSSVTVSIQDSISCSAETQSTEIYGRVWEVIDTFCEDGTGSVAQRNLNFYTNEPTGAEWVTVKIRSGSETPVELATSGSATGSYSYNTNDTLFIDIFTGSNDAFYLRREYSGSSDESGSAANITGSEVTNSLIISGNANLTHFNQNTDVSLAFGLDYSSSIEALHITVSKINTEEETTNINFKLNRQIPLSKIRDNFTASVENLSLTGSGGTNITDGSGSNFIAINNEFPDIIYGNTGSFIGPNTQLFRPTYAFGNIFNTISGSNVDYTSGHIWSGSVSASYFGADNAYYFTQRENKMWLLTADTDNIGFLEAYSYTDPNQFASDPLGTRTNLDPYTYRDYTIYAGSQKMEHDLMYVMIIHEDEDTIMPLPTGIGGGEIFSRRLENIQDVNRIYYLLLSPNATTGSQADIDNRSVAVGKYFIDNVIYG